MYYVLYNRRAVGSFTSWNSALRYARAIGLGSMEIISEMRVRLSRLTIYRPTVELH